MDTPRVDHPGRMLEWLELPSRFEEPRLLRFAVPASLSLVLLLLAPLLGMSGAETVALLGMSGAAAVALFLVPAATAAAERSGRLERRWLEVSSSGLRIRLSRRLAEPPAEIPWDAIIWVERDSAIPLVRTDGQPRRRGVSRWRVFDRTVLYLNPAKTTPQLVRVTIGYFDFDLSGVGLINLLRQVHVGFAGAAVDIAAGNYLREGRKCEPWNGEAWTYDEADAAEQKLKARLPGPVYLLYRIFGALFGLVTVVALLAVLLLTS